MSSWRGSDAEMVDLARDLPTRSTTRFLVGFVGVLLSFFVGGCDAEVRTSITVESLETQVLEIGVGFTDEAAAAIEEPENLQEILNLFRTHLGQDPEIESRNSAITFKAPVTYEQLRRLSDLTGVAEATVSSPQDELVTVRVRFVDPSALRQAIRDSTDEPGVSDAMEGATAISVAVKFPGPVTSVGGDVPATIVGNEAVFSATLETFPEGVGTVTGSLNGPTEPTQVPVEAVVTVTAVVITVGYLWWSRRRSHR